MVKDDLIVKIWGTRGSMAAPFSDRMEFGGNTSCVSVMWENQVLIFDCGTGIRPLGAELMKRCADQELSIHIFISHMHLDHMIGLPFFPPIYKKSSIHLYGRKGDSAELKDKIRTIMGSPFWPVSVDHAGADIEYHELSHDTITELPGGVTVHAIHANHSGDALIFRLERSGTSMVYGLDYELDDRTETEYCDFIRSSSLLIFDGAYTPEEYPQFRGFGHSTWRRGIEAGLKSGVERICISHHEWARTDSELRELEKKAKSIYQCVDFAREGMEYRLGKRDEA